MWSIIVNSCDKIWREPMRGMVEVRGQKGASPGEGDTRWVVWFIESNERDAWRLKVGHTSRTTETTWG